METAPSTPYQLSDTLGKMETAPSTNRLTATRADLLRRDFYEQSNWFEIMCEILFHIKARGVTIQSEVYCGVIQFISCLYVLAVVPQQLSDAGYNAHASVCITALACGFGSILGGLVANLPFIIAPPTAVSIFFSVYLQERNMGSTTANIAVVLAGVLLIFLGYRPFGRIFSYFIPNALQIGVAVGIGLFTALAGATEIDLVVGGRYTIVAMGPLTPEILVAMSGIIIVSVSLHYHFKAAFCYSIVFTTLVWWAYKNEWPDKIAESPYLTYINWGKRENEDILLTFDLFFLTILFLNGLICSLSDLAQLTRENGSIPRSRWLFVVCGVSTIFSGMFCGAPVLISPESSAGIKAGARTGLSTVVCGVLFVVSTLFSPIFENVPPAGTAGVLIMIGAILFQNVMKMDWHLIREAVPCFCTLFFIVSTYSILQGAAIGYAVYIIINVFTGDLELLVRQQIKDFFYPKRARARRQGSGALAGNDQLRESGVTATSEDGGEPDSVIAQCFHHLAAAMDQVDEVVAVNMGYHEAPPDGTTSAAGSRAASVQHPEAVVSVM